MPIILFPVIDPVLFSIGPFALRWYALAYIGGIVLGWWYSKRVAARSVSGLSVTIAPRHFDDFVVYATLGIVLGGRLGYVFFYQPEYFLNNPLEALQLWQGGMSFHGGLVGVILATSLFVWRRKLPFLAFADIVAMAAPIGIGLGRIANFINGELWGRPTTVPWAMLFPYAGSAPRHPSQIYEAILEGLVLFWLLFIAERLGWRRRPGVMLGSFLIGYGIFRSISELFREPDNFKGFLIAGTTMGQLLSLPLILSGLILIIFVIKSEKK